MKISPKAIVSLLPTSDAGKISLLIAIVCAYIAYQYTKNIEGMTANEDISGGASGAELYATRVKERVIKLQDVLLVDKYKNNYENIIVSLDDLINNTMLEKTLSIDPKDPVDALADLASLHQSKLALNSVMKFVGDS